MSCYIFFKIAKIDKKWLIAFYLFLIFKFENIDRLKLS